MAKNLVKVEVVTEYSHEIAVAIGKLMPDLSERLCDESIPEDRLKTIIESDDRELFVAKLNDEVVGTAVLNLIVGTAGRKAWLEDFVVSSKDDIRGSGVGYSIWQELLRWCKERDVDLNFTSNPRRGEARKFYLRQKAQVLDTKVLRVNVSDTHQ